MVVRFVKTGATVGVGTGVSVGVGATFGASVALASGVSISAVIAVGSAVGKAVTGTVALIVELGDCVWGFEPDVFVIRVGSRVGTDSGDSDSLPQAAIRKTKLSPNKKLSNFICPAVTSDLVAIERFSLPNESTPILLRRLAVFNIGQKKSALRNFSENAPLS